MALIRAHSLPEPFAARLDPDVRAELVRHRKATLPTELPE